MENAEKRLNLLKPGLLLVLFEGPTHGYNLKRKLEKLDFWGKEKVDAGRVYRLLREMEKEGLVESAWNTSQPGPAKREYRATARAVKALAFWADGIEENIQRLKNFLQRLKEACKK